MINGIKRIIIVLIGLLLQFGFSFTIRVIFYEQFTILNLIYRLIGIFIVLNILKNSTKPSRDIPWIILILLFPLFGTVLYISLGRNYSRSKLLKSILNKEEEFSKYLKQDKGIKEEIEEKELDNLKYIMDISGYPVSKNTKLTYYNFGEKFYPDLLNELKKAEKFIFMEYFIINKGTMWNGILDILKEKASNGVDVRILYDDMGSITMLSTKYPKELSEYGIKCIPFNILSPFRGIFMNNRDHRKMTIIDGKIAFSGGVNLSDEYINIKSRFGVWKDNGIKIEGDAIWNLTVMFLTLWNSNREDDNDLLKFKYNFKNQIKEKGYVSPYGVAPLHKNTTGEDVYINMINSSKNYLYIMTPYLIIDTDMINSLIRAAKRGVDVRIIIPGIPDKKITYTQTCSYFKVLYDGGVKIYKYNPGFIHSKVLLSDDIRSVVGTINMDYRSLYLHFENGIYMENVNEIKNIKKDFDETFEKSSILTEEDVKTSFIKNLWQSILRLLAPLF